MNDIEKKDKKQMTIEDIYNVKLEYFTYLNALKEADRNLDKCLDKINGYEPYRIEFRFGCHGKDNEEKYIDQTCWRYLERTFELKKYMLCTDYEKLTDQIEHFSFPVFTIDNASGWLDNLKDLIYTNIKTMVQTVYEKLINDKYYTGSGGFNSRTKKKRNNNGVDEHFILTTNDWSCIFNYWHKPTISDDLEKVCYILNNKSVPNLTFKDQMKNEKTDTFENEYFKIKVCKNGNTHYWIKKETLDKFNKYGSNGNLIGQDIKIKVFDK